MPVHDDLGLRMKEKYEKKSRTYLKKKTPVIIRIDGKAFHTFTKGFRRPFDKLLMVNMQDTMKFLCENIQGCVLGYTQSDEISLLLIDYQNEKSESWFENQVQKMCSIASSMATLEFNRSFASRYLDISTIVNGNYSPKSRFLIDNPDNDFDELIEDLKYYDLLDFAMNDWDKYEKLLKTYDKAYNKGAMFDARCFSIPQDEVTNYFYWRQLDAVRNSIQMAGQANFSHKQLQKKSCSMIRKMLIDEKWIDWNDFITDFKRGSCAIKTVETIKAKDRKTGELVSVDRHKWIIDHDIPVFKDEDREYIDKYVYIN